MPMPPHAAQRVKLDRAGVKKSLSLSSPDIANATDAELDAALATVDLNALYDQERPPWTTEVWDKTSPINDVPASEILKRPDVPANGDIYLLRENGVITVFQPHPPEVQGLEPIAKGRGMMMGREHADIIAAHRAQSRGAQMIVDHVRNARKGAV